MVSTYSGANWKTDVGVFIFHYADVPPVPSNGRYLVPSAQCLLPESLNTNDKLHISPGTGAFSFAYREPAATAPE